MPISAINLVFELSQPFLELYRRHKLLRHPFLYEKTEDGIQMTMFQIFVELRKFRNSGIPEFGKMSPKSIKNQVFELSRPFLELYRRQELFRHLFLCEKTDDGIQMTICKKMWNSGPEFRNSGIWQNRSKIHKKSSF